MIGQARELAAWVAKHRVEQAQWETLGIEPDDVSVAEMIEYLRTQLPERGGLIDGGKLLLEQPTASRRACLFLGMLEMAREQDLELAQSETFGPLWLSIP